MKSFLQNAALLIVLLALGIASGTGIQRLRAHYDRPDTTPVAGDYSALIAQGDAPVVLFSTSTCPWCKRAAEFLTERRIPYRNVDVMTPEGKALFDQYRGEAVPLLMTSNLRLQGFDEGAYVQHLLPFARGGDGGS